jgi:hypothetical protein
MSGVYIPLLLTIQKGAVFLMIFVQMPKKDLLMLFSGGAHAAQIFGIEISGCCCSCVSGVAKLMPLVVKVKRVQQ